jgi:amino acid adenylation domain-containing protein
VNTEAVIKSNEVPDHGERKLPLTEWNNTRTNYPRNLCVHQLFEEQVKLRPQAVAIRFRSQQMTYEQLNHKANQLAHCLRKLGVGPDVMVGMLLERSFEMLVGLLGILKAGGAYVSLDPSYPAERLSFMASDTEASVVLVQGAVTRRMAEQNWSTARTVSLDAETSGFNTEPDDDLPNTNTSENLAYVMYTSGSTGRPKGVMVNHRAIVRLVKNTNYVDLSEKEVFLQFSPISFDASTLEIWAPLLNGGCLSIMPPETQSLDELGATIRAHGVTSMWLTAGLFNVMVEQRLDDLRPLRQLLVGGDTLSPTHIRKAMEALPGCRFINGYGPTEGTTFTCCHTITKEDTTGSIPIGKPISNTQVYLLDSDLQPVPIGEVGELYAGGDGLARGYLNAPDLTAERFLPNPMGKHPGECIYKTGDLARYRVDGTIEFLGRSDHQVKVNGFRIELGEIENVLMNHAKVRSAVVVARQEPCGEKKLTAYIVLHTQDADTSDLRNFVQLRLPSYMLPSTFVVLQSLPLSPNGKVDRAALPVAEAPRAPRTDGNSLETDLEAKISAIWQRVLRQKQIGVNENFFDLGGDSLELLAAHAELQRLISPDLPITAMFQYTTISALAQYLSGNNSPSHATEAQERAHKQQAAWNQHRPLQISQPLNCAKEA